MTDVFISYSRKDYRYDEGKGEIIPGNPITRVKEALDKAGISYWIDEELSLGADWGKILPKKIRSAHFFLFVSSKYSNTHVYTKSEVQIAIEHKKKIIPFKIDDTIYNDDIIAHIAGLQHNLPYDLNPIQALEGLVRSIEQLKREEELKTRLIQIETEKSHLIEKRDALQSKMDCLSNEYNKLNSSISKVEEEKKIIEEMLSPGSKPKIDRMRRPEAFLLVEEYNEQQIYCIYKGKNSFGSVKRNEENHQQIVLSSDILKGTHFSITVEFPGQQKTYRLSVYEPNSIGLNAKDNIVGEDTQINPNDVLVMDNVKIKLIENLN